VKETFQQQRKRVLLNEIEDERKLAPMTVASHTVSGKCALAVELVTVIQKLRLIEIQNETILRNLDL